MDIEQRPVAEKHFLNTTVHKISWSGLTVAVKDRRTGQTKNILDNVEGLVNSGDCCAVMGPSGCGKTTLLNALARRPINATVDGRVCVNSTQLPDAVFRHVTSFVEDHDTFIGSLTVRETLQFASKLAGITSRRHESQARIDTLLKSFGLVDQASALVGKGISKGQKRRLAVAERLVTGPKILFLDEPTSGLDSVASFHIISYLRDLAKRNNLIIICSIHQPSTSTFNLFNKLLLLSAGKTQYFGARSTVIDYCEGIGVTIPQRVNPADFLLELVNIDFSQDITAASQRIADLQSLWQASNSAQLLCESILATDRSSEGLSIQADDKPSIGGQLMTLLQRSFLKAYRDVMAYTFRLVMYMGLAILMGTIWLQLDRNQDSIQLLINALLVSCGFMAFMAVTYVPAFIEDHQQYIHEHRNGLYGATLFSVSNFLVGMPHLFLFSIIFSIIFYWLSNCQNSSTAFLTWVTWLFFDLLAAEAVVVLAVSIVPNFVGALVLVAFINVLWFATAGALVPPEKLNSFYKYGFYYWNFQSYVFQGMMVTQFDGETYDCGSGCHCRYDPILTSQCHIAGETVLNQFGYKTEDQKQNIGIVIVIILGYRLTSWAILKLKH
ncbi:hypothetical protein V502_02899 [Pseudogymnoascus sp. VKM F-4520 (FW-2644)]|nr:hypothetical protein V502_02899 [Pseudogymnoascus sp. VKM F-4520 (FW-2644)]